MKPRQGAAKRRSNTRAGPWSRANSDPTGGSIRRSNVTDRTRKMVLPALLISGSLVLAAVQVGCVSQTSQADAEQAAERVPPPSSGAVQVAPSPDELNQLVAPIALYPDALVAQI